MKDNIKSNERIKNIIIALAKKYPQKYFAKYINGELFLYAKEKKKLFSTINIYTKYNSKGKEVTKVWI